MKAFSEALVNKKEGQMKMDRFYTPHPKEFSEHPRSSLKLIPQKDTLMFKVMRRKSHHESIGKSKLR